MLGSQVRLEALLSSREKGSLPPTTLQWAVWPLRAYLTFSQKKLAHFITSPEKFLIQVKRGPQHNRGRL